MAEIYELNTIRESFTVATAPTAFATRWKNERLTWEAFCQKLSVPVRTKETMKEFDSMPKAEQGTLKNVGGYVGGYVKDGQRKKGNVERRTLLTLDADSADDNFPLIIRMFYEGFNYCIYSTRSDRKNARRFRLVFKLDTPLEPDKYEALGRKVAEEIGIDNFDETTFQPERLMYWGSCSADQDYFFHHSSGRDLPTAEILAKYNVFGDNPNAWQDCSLWATASSANVQAINREIKRQVNPLEKQGIIGSFCRSYDIPSAIEEFLSDIYVPVNDKCDRYTYTKGHTAGGLVLYLNGLFAYAHQATDPCQGRLCNAWDLVRIHLFGENEKESTSKMKELVLSKPKVRDLLMKERQKKAMDVFKDITDKPEIDPHFTDKLTVDKQGVTEATARNVRLIMQNDEMLSKAFRYDVFASRVRINVPPIWRKHSLVTSDVWTDTDDDCLVNYFDDMYGISGSKAVAIIGRVFSEETNRRGYHPVQDYLRKASLMWDGEQRAETLFIDYLGAEDNRYNRLACRKMLLASVRRIFNPGVKFDNICVLSGGQGIGKTTLLERLGGAWFTNSLRDVSTKEAFQQIQGKWIVEMGELASLRISDTDTIKNFISKTSDSYRPPFGHRTIDKPRQCVFFGTSNSMKFLTDASGNRRFWIVPCCNDRKSLYGRHVYSAFTPEFVEQVWGEVMSWGMDEPLTMPSDMMDEILEREDRYSACSSDAETLRTYLNTPVPTAWRDWSIPQRKDWFENRTNPNVTVVEGASIRNYISLTELRAECKALKDVFGYTSQTNFENLMTRLASDWVYTGALKDCGLLFGKQRVYERVEKVEV